MGDSYMDFSMGSSGGKGGGGGCGSVIAAIILTPLLLWPAVEWGKVVWPLTEAVPILGWVLYIILMAVPPIILFVLVCYVMYLREEMKKDKERERLRKYGIKSTEEPGKD